MTYNKLQIGNPWLKSNFCYAADEVSTVRDTDNSSGKGLAGNLTVSPGIFSKRAPVDEDVSVSAANGTPANTKHLYKICAVSKPLGQRCTNDIQMFCVCWVHFLPYLNPKQVYSRF